MLATGYYALTTEDGGRWWAAFRDRGDAVVADATAKFAVPRSAGETLEDAHHQVDSLRRIPGGGRAAADEWTEDYTGGPVADFRELLRFDATPASVMRRFPRVSTVLADLNLQGLRVPLVTGTRSDDIAGTLTYAFDSRGELQRITLHGFTGDPSRLVDLMTRHYGLSPRESLEAGVYTRDWNGRPVHFLRLSYAPVVRRDDTHGRYTVFLELNQTSLAHGVSAEAQRIISRDRGATRW